MKTHIALIVAILFAFTGCQSSGKSQSSGTHTMGSPKSSYQMSNQDMKKHQK